jgi:hypothetical protein
LGVLDSTVHAAVAAMIFDFASHQSEEVHLRIRTGSINHHVGGTVMPEPGDFANHTGCSMFDYVTGVQAQVRRCIIEPERVEDGPRCSSSMGTPSDHEVLKFNELLHYDVARLLSG